MKAAGTLLCALLLISSQTGSAMAAESDPIVRIEVEPATLTVGEAATMRITVLVPTWQPAPPVYPAFEVPNAITRLPPDSAYPISERIGRETWSGIVRNYRVTPLVAASFRLGGESIRVTWADPGAANRVSDLPVPYKTLKAQIPPGAEGIEPYLAGRHFEIERTFDGDPQTLAVGDALMVHYRAVLDGMPALFIPPLAPDLTSDLAAVYPREPVVRDGETAERLETLTLVLEHGGALFLPGRTLSWWNQAEERVEQAIIEPATLQITGPPAETAAEAPAEWRPWLLPAALVAAGLLGLGLRRGLPVYREHRRAARAAYLASEGHAFRILSRAETPEAFYHAAVHWLHRLDPALDLRSFATEFGRPELPPALDELSAGLYGEAHSNPDIPQTLRALRPARSRYLARNRSGQAGRLAPLNPTKASLQPGP